eukprot:GHVO01053415.1.p2 GENE.GHVO01053415.1~~GHVO01053415.1.p2  ORF type:complete len:139 (-),score=10.51 GHVO01053415.1:58-474(-)
MCALVWVSPAKQGFIILRLKKHTLLGCIHSHRSRLQLDWSGDTGFGCSEVATATLAARSEAAASPAALSCAGNETPRYCSRILEDAPSMIASQFPCGRESCFRLELADFSACFRLDNQCTLSFEPAAHRSVLFEPGAH